MIGALLGVTASCSQQSAPTSAQEAGGGGEERQANTFRFRPNPRSLPEREVTTLPIGHTLPDFRLPGADERYWTFDDFNNQKPMVIVFTCNHCPTAQAYEQRIIDIARDYRAKGVHVVAISPNSPPAVLFEECGYTDLDDTFESMKLRAAAREFNFPYLYDGDSHGLSMVLGPTTTPHAFVFDGDRELKYSGRIDDKENPADGGRGEDLRAALDAVLAGNNPEPATTKAFGCSIKWAWKTEGRASVEEQWAAKPVELDPIDAGGVAELLANEGEKLRLINVWATWCGPCLVEFPELIKMQRFYGHRDFEVVSVSADTEDKQADALDFLQEKHAAFRNTIWTGGDKYALIEAIDPDWDGALPYTVLVAPGGEIVHRVQGSIKPIEMRQKIVDHPVIGRYF